MITLSYGYKKPEPPDTGDIFFGAIEFDIQRLNDHDHDGLNSAPLASEQVSVLSASWVAAPQGGGLYRQAVTIPTGFSYDTCDMWFKFDTGEIVYPTIERISASSLYIYTNDNTKDYVAYFR